MTITYTLDRLRNERVIQTVPSLSARVEEWWYQRPHIYKGRALTDKALIENAQHHIKHLQLFGQHLSSGVIQGLEVSHYQKKAVSSDGAAQTETWLQITPGIGLTHKGDDVSLTNITHVALEEVYTVATLVPGDIESEAVWKRLLEYNYIKGDWREAGRFYLTLYSRSRDKVKEQLENIGVTEPTPILTAWDKTQLRPKGPGMLVLEPIEIIDEVNEAGDSQCPWDPEQDPFDDERLIDGCRLVFYPWPTQQVGKPPATRDPHFRNKLVYQVFDYEQAQYQKRGRSIRASMAVDYQDILQIHKDYQPYIPLPWEHYGVALALVDVTANGKIRFLDTYAVKRKGGAPLSTWPMVEMNGSPFLWEARIQQFVDHLYDLAQDTKTVPVANKHFDVLPPVGLLPKQLLDFRSMRSGFFPSQFVVEAAPIPEEQLELAMNASASLEPFDVYRPERVKLLVPVPQEVFEPDLLKKAQPDPIFLSTIRQLVHQIRLVLGARNQYRDMAAKVIGAIDWHDVPSYDADRDATPDEGKFPVTLPAISVDTFGSVAVTAIVKLWKWIIQNTEIKADSDVESLKEKENIGTWKFPGLEQIIVNFQRKIDQTELYLSTGFLRVEADIYRLRQMMLGNEKATRLATSPAIGQIVEGYTRPPTIEDLEIYFTKASRKEEEEQGSSESLAAAAVPGATRKAARENTSFWKKYKKPTDIEVLKGFSRSKAIVDRVYEAPAAEVKHNTVITKSLVFDILAKVPLNMDDDQVTVTSSDRGIMTSSEYDTWIVDLGGKEDPKAKVVEQRTKKSKDYVTIVSIPLTKDEKKDLKDADVSDEDVKELEKDIRKQRGKNRASMKDENIADAIRDGIFDPDPKDGDEANYFSVGVEALENALEAMHKVDRSLDDYRKALAQAQRVLQQLRFNAKQWRLSLSEKENELSEYRHDALVARSLYEEERARVNAVNQHRLRILEQYVSSLAYVRPRLVEARRNAPTVKLHAEYVSPVPACLAEDYEATDELRDMLDVFREVPVNWFNNAKPLVALLNHPLQLIEAFQHAAQRSQQKSVSSPPPGNYKAYHANAMGEAVNQLVFSQRAVTQQYYDKKVTIDIEALKSKTWKDLRFQAEKELSLADLIESGQGKSALAKKAASVMEAMEDIAVCLYNRCNELAPAIRLRWADKISVFDQPVELQHLDIMPSWDQLDYGLRRDLQNMVDWLFAQVDPDVVDAHKLMNDLVRVCILLASHAPVSTIIRGHVPNATQGKVGDIIDVAIAKGVVKVGMVATVMSQDAVMVQGVVEDVGAGAVSIKVNESKDKKGQFYVSKDAQVMFRPGSGGKKAGKR